MALFWLSKVAGESLTAGAAFYDISHQSAHILVSVSPLLVFFSYFLFIKNKRRHLAFTRLVDSQLSMLEESVAESENL